MAGSRRQALIRRRSCQRFAGKNRRIVIMPRKNRRYPLRVVHATGERVVAVVVDA